FLGGAKRETDDQAARILAEQTAKTFFADDLGERQEFIFFGEISQSQRRDAEHLRPTTLSLTTAPHRFRAGRRHQQMGVCTTRGWPHQSSAGGFPDVAV